MLFLGELRRDTLPKLVIEHTERLLHGEQVCINASLYCLLQIPTQKTLSVHKDQLNIPRLVASAKEFNEVSDLVSLHVLSLLTIDVVVAA